MLFVSVVNYLLFYFLCYIKLWSKYQENTYFGSYMGPMVFVVLLPPPKCDFCIFVTFTL